MDTAIAIIIIAVAALFVFNKVRKQLNARERGGCGCSGGCSEGSSACCGGNAHKTHGR